MGIGITPNLGLIVPDLSEFVPNQVGIFEDNYNKLDALINAATEPQTYVPIIGSASTGPVAQLGDDGEIAGFWLNVFDVVFAWGYFQVGTVNVNMGSGSNWFTITLPVPSSGLNFVQPGTDTTKGSVIGSCIFSDNGTSANRQGGGCQLFDADKIWFLTETGIGTRAARHDAPFTWSNSDRLAWGVRYRGAF